MKTTVIIPAYEPDEKMRELVFSLKEKGFDILLIDDGSGDAYLSLFENLPMLNTLVRCHLKRNIPIGFCAIVFLKFKG